jgi:hypothetical protein
MEPFVLIVILAVGYIVFSTLSGGAPNVTLMIIVIGASVAAFTIFQFFDYRARRMGLPLAIIMITTAFVFYPFFQSILLGNSINNPFEMLISQGSAAPDVPMAPQMQITGTDETHSGTEIAPTMVVYKKENNTYNVPNYTLNIDELNTNDQLGLDILKT